MKEEIKSCGYTVDAYCNIQSSWSEGQFARPPLAIMISTNQQRLPPTISSQGNDAIFIKWIQKNEEKYQ